MRPRPIGPDRSNGGVAGCSGPARGARRWSRNSSRMPSRSKSKPPPRLARVDTLLRSGADRGRGRLGDGFAGRYDRNGARQADHHAPQSGRATSRDLRYPRHRHQARRSSQSRRRAGDARSNILPGRPRPIAEQGCGFRCIDRSSQSRTWRRSDYVVANSNSANDVLQHNVFLQSKSAYDAQMQNYDAQIASAQANLTTAQDRRDGSDPAA